MENNFNDPFDSLDDQVLPSEDDLAELNFGTTELENILSDLLPFGKMQESYR